MFAPRQRPLLVVEERLLAVRQSLNTPVLSTAELPAGPARAVIAVYAEGPVRRFAVVVRSLRDGATVTYELEDDDAHDDDGWAVALDASLSFGESMGFVFDDEMILDRRPETLRRALACLHEILSPPSIAPDAAPRTRALASERAAKPPDELAEILLEDELDVLSPDPDEATGAAFTGPLARTADAAPPAAAPSVSLSKFRAAPPAAAAATELTQRSMARLGRVRPVRVRVDGDAAPKVEPLVRLLADF